MPYQFSSKNEYIATQKQVTILVKFAVREGKKGNDENRKLFLRLAVVQLVTAFQVFTESILKEFEYWIQQSNKKNKNLDVFFRLNSLNIDIKTNRLEKFLEDSSNYNHTNLTKVKNLISNLNDFCDDEKIIGSYFKINTKYPLGKQGLNELKGLFKQIQGIDIFDSAPFDINKLNEILGRRHSIIHDGSNMQLTETTLREYREFMALVVNYIHKYLQKHLR